MVLVRIGNNLFINRLEEKMTDVALIIWVIFGVLTASVWGTVLVVAIVLLFTLVIAIAAFIYNLIDDLLW